MSADPRNRKLLAALASAQRLAEDLTATGGAEAETLVEQLKAEGSRAMQQAVVLSLAYVADEPTPISVFRPFASYASFRRWELEGRVKLHRINGKVAVAPREFFRFWRTLMAEGRTAKK